MRGFGVVQDYFVVRGYGYINTHKIEGPTEEALEILNEKIYFHHSGYRGEPREGAHVIFKIGRNKRGFLAKKIKERNLEGIVKYTPSKFRGGRRMKDRTSKKRALRYS